MSKKFDCLGIGLATLDYLSLVREFPRPGLKLEVVESVIDGGGPVPTALATLARLGAHCAYLGRLGDDAQGKLVIRKMVDESNSMNVSMLEQGFYFYKLMNSGKYLGSGKIIIK